MFFVGFLLSYVVPIFRSAVAFNLLSCCVIIRDNSQSKGRGRGTDARMTDEPIFLHHYNFQQLTARHNLTSQFMQLIATPKEGTMQYTR